jgi:sterol desaturase/sphingolipid hydroxylase (fatty acid hydroxylase superfamily)
VFRRQIIFDLLLWFLNPFSHLIAFLGVNWVLSTILGGPPKKWIEVGGYPFGVQLFLLILMIDVLNYWTHRLLHTRWLWPIHAVHHSAQEMDWLSGTRVHPLQSIIWILPTMTVMQFVHTNVFDAAWVGFLFRFQLALAHSNLAWDYGWLGQWVVSPLFHRWHHTFPSQGGEKNFAAIFTVCDRLFGTLYVPQEGDRPLKLGVLKPSVESFE